MKLPHWAMVCISLASIIVAWLMQQNANGSLVLPAVVLTVLPLLAAILGIMSPSASAKANTKAALKTGLVAPVSEIAKAAAKIAPLAMLCALLCTGCPQGVAAIGPGIVFAGCVWSTYEKEAPGVPIVQVVADELAACGGDAASVIVVLGQHEPSSSHEHVAHEDVAKAGKP